jgi:hypothetical protein
MKVIDYSTAPNTNLKQGMNAGNYSNTFINKTPTNTLTTQNINNSSLKLQAYSINNYQPELNKKNNFNSGVASNNIILNRTSGQQIKQGPIKYV